MKFLFEPKFNLFDIIAYGVIIVSVIHTNNYWLLLIIIPLMAVSVVMQDKLRVQELYRELGIK
jgi:hypothetical protein